MRPRWGAVALAALPLLFLGWFFVYPLATILTEGATSDGLDFVLSGTFASTAWFTIWQAALSTVLTLLAAAPLTWAVSNHDFRGRRLVMALVTVPFVLPTVVVAGAFIALDARDSVAAILAAHVFFNVSVFVRTVSTVWSRLDRSPIEAARTLGASNWRAFREITLPLLTPSIAAASSIVFLLCFSSFGIVLLLGGLRYRTIEVEIFQRVATFLDVPSAAAMAIIQLVAISAIMYVYARIQESRSRRVRLVSEALTLRRAQGRRAWLVGSVVVGTLGALAVPVAVLVSRSLDSGWRFLVDSGSLALDPPAAIRNSLSSAVVAAVVALGVGVPAALVIAPTRAGWGRGLDVVIMLPLGTSAVTVGLGLLVALDAPIDLRTSPALVPIAHALVALPFVVRAVLPTIRSIRSVLRDAATVLGASPRQVWRHVDLPLISRSVAVAGGFAAAVSLGEFGATAFIVRPSTITVPTLIYRLLGRPGAVTFSGAMALSVVLMLMVTALIMGLDRLRAGELGSF